MSTPAACHPTDAARWDYLTFELLTVPDAPGGEVPVWLYEQHHNGMVVALVPDMHRPVAGLVPMGDWRQHATEDRWLLVTLSDCITRSVDRGA